MFTHGSPLTSISSVSIRGRGKKSEKRSRGHAFYRRFSPSTESSVRNCCFPQLRPARIPPVEPSARYGTARRYPSPPPPPSFSPAPATTPLSLVRQSELALTDDGYRDTCVRRRYAALTLHRRVATRAERSEKGTVYRPVYRPFGFIAPPIRMLLIPRTQGAALHGGSTATGALASPENVR